MARDFCEQRIKLATAREQLHFNLRCKRQDILPKSLIFQPPIKTRDAYDIAKNSGRQYLKCFIKNDHYRINQCTASIRELKRELTELLPSDLYHTLTEVADNKLKNKTDELKQQLKSKFSALL